MKNYLLVVFAALLMFACQSKQEVTVNFTVVDKDYEPVGLALEKTDTMFTLAADGKGSLIVPLKEAQYGMISYKWKQVPVYLEPGQSLNVKWDMTPSGLEVYFEGEAAKINTYMNDKSLKQPLMGDFGLDEEEFVKKMDAYVAEDYKILESKGFNKTFVEKEKKRIDYMVYGILWQYGRKDNLSEGFYDKIKQLMVEEEWMLQLSEYTNFMLGAINTLSCRDLDVENLDPLDETMRQLNYAVANLKNPVIREFVIATNACSYIDQEGVDDAAEVKKIFEENVKDPQMVSVFNNLYAEGSTITKGKKTIGFNLEDVNGKMVNLNDFAGKYVYIDFWATWCGPCREELPHMQRLIEAFTGTNIAFVGISLDSSKEAWSKVVKDEKMGGIQLYGGAENEFAKSLRVSGIPRFVLLDTEGKIVEANMSRPSEEKTLEYLGMLAEPLE